MTCLDFQKAFDKVPHKRLLNNMSTLKIGVNILAWTASQLMDKKNPIGLGYYEWCLRISCHASAIQLFGCGD